MHWVIDTGGFPCAAACRFSVLQDDYIAVPEAPGLGIELNEEVIREHLTPGDPAGYFEPSTYWDTDRSWDRSWS